MIAYNKTSLDQLTVVEEATTAFKKKLISDEEYVAISKIHKPELYRPNIFIRIGLFAATVVIINMTFGLVFLIFGTAIDNDRGLFLMSFFFAAIVYAALEWIVKIKKHYRSGVDDAMLWLAFLFVISDVTIFSDISSFWTAVLLFITSLAATIRFANSVMSAVTFCSLVAVIFFGFIQFGPTSKSILPFAVLLLSFSVYLVVKKFQHKHSLRHYKFCFVMLQVLSLATIYTSVNYFVVRELSTVMFDLPANAPLTGGLFFWICTYTLPLLYIMRGLQSKDHLILRTGLLLIAATVFTFRYYYHLAPVEQILTAGGIMLIFLSYAAIRYLKTPRHGITDKPYEHKMEDLQVESLVIGETFGEIPAAGDGFTFGGGSTGGGGATGQF